MGARRGTVLRGLGLSFVVLVVTASAVLAQESPVLEGKVTLNGTEAQRGVRLVAADAEGTECGLTVVGTGGQYSMTISPTCSEGTSVHIKLAATEDRVDATREIPPPGTSKTFDIDFEISEAALQRVLDEAEAVSTVGEDIEVMGAPEQAFLADLAEEVSDRSEPVIQAADLDEVLKYLIFAGIGLLGLLAVARVFESWRYHQLIENLDESKLVKLSEAGSAGLLQRRGFSRWVVEGLVLSFVIIAIVILGVAGTITKEGIVSVLAAVVGYAAGRSTSRTGES